MAAADDDDSDVILLVHQLPVDMDGPDEGRLAHLLPPLHRAPPPPPPPPFRPPPPPQAVASAEHRLYFRGWLGAPRHWEVWVAKLRPLHAPLWRRLGIHDAVLASTYRIKPDASHVLHLASFWSPATSSFAFPWGEATLTLHDVAVIAGLPSTGSPVPAPLQPEWRPDEAALNGVRLGFNRSACKKAHLSAWIKHFLTDHTDTVLEHAAFLALWLTRFVLPGHPDSTMRQAVFPIAVRLARGERVALAPAVLASLYRDLRDIKTFLVAAGATATTGNADMLSSLSLYSPIYLLHLWIWEHFPKLRPGRENMLGDGEPMAARWHDLSRKANPTLIREVLSSRDNFLWRLPYVTALKKYSGWVCSSDITGNDELRLLAHCLRPCELVGMDCIEQYLPHRVARQFGLDQDVPMDVRRANQDWVVAWQTYELEGKNVSLFIPQSEPGITARYAQWWRQQVQPSDTHAVALSIPLESKASKRKVKKTLVAMEAEAEKERRMKKARVSPSDKKRKLEELYDPKFSGWLAAGRSGISDAAGSSCKKGSLSKYDMGSDEALLPNVGATNDDVVLLLPRIQTTSPTVVVPKKDDTMNPVIGDGGNSIVDMPPEIFTNEVEGGATAMQKEETLNNPVGKSLDIPDKPEGDTLVMKSEKEAVEISVTRSLGINRPEGTTLVMELEKEAMETHNIPEDDTTKVPQLGYEELRDAAPIEKDTKEKPCADDKDLAEKDVDESTEVCKVKEAEGEGCDLLELEKEAMETHNIPEDDTTKVPQLGYEELRDAAPIEEDTKEKPCADDKDLAEKDVDESTEVCKVKEAEGEGCDLLMEKYCDNIADALGEGRDLLIEKDGGNNTDALGVEQAAEGQATSLTKKDIHDHVEEITVLEQLDELSERATRIGVEDITEEITKAHEKEYDNDMTTDSKKSTDSEMLCSSARIGVEDITEEITKAHEKEYGNDMTTDSKKSTDSEMLCSSATVQFKGAMVEKQCIHNVVPNNQMELSSECNAAGVKVEGIYDHRTMDMEELALTQEHGHKIIDENKATAILERSHMLDSVVNSDLIILEVDEIHTAEEIQNQGIMDLDKIMVPKQKQDHRIIWENKETMVSEGSHMLDSRVKSDSVTLETDETHAVGGIRHQEILGLDMEMALKQKQEHIIACENKETTELRGMNCEVDKTLAEGNENQDILDVNKQQGMSGTQDLGTAIENNKMNMLEDEDIPVCSGYQIGPTIESTKMNTSEDAGTPDCSDQIDPSGIEVNEVKFTKRLQNQELSDNREQPAMEEGQPLETIIENSKMNLPNEADALVCGEHQIDSTGTEVAEVKSSSVIQNQDFLDKTEDQVTEKRMECETAYEDGVSLEEAYKLGDGVDTCVVTVNDQITEKRMECEIAYESRSLEEAYKLGGADTCGVAVNVSDSMQNKETCTTEEAMEDKQHNEVEHVNDERILEDRTMIDSSELKSDATHVEVAMAGSKEGTQNQHASDVEVDMAGSKEGTLNQHATDVEVDMAGSKEGTLNQHATDVEADIAGSKEETLNQYALSVETVASMQEKQDHEVAGEDTNKDVADVNALECRVKPDGAVILFHETLLTAQSVSSKDKENAPSFEEHNITEVAAIESNQTTLVELEGALPLETKNMVEAKQENVESETERSIFRENDEVSCKDQTSACIMISPSNVDDQCDDDNGWAEEPTKSNDKLASDSINTSCCNPIKFGKSSNEEVKRAQNIRSMYLKDIKESLGRIRAEPLNRVHAANFGYPSRHAVQESHSACKESKVPLRDSGRDIVRDRALELVATSPAEESSRWRQEQYALQILEDVQNARIAEKTRMEMEIRILKAQIASMERQVMNLDQFSEVKSRSKGTRH